MLLHIHFIFTSYSLRNKKNKQTQNIQRPNPIQQHLAQMQTTNFVKSFWRPSFIHYICKANSCKNCTAISGDPALYYTPRTHYVTDVTTLRIAYNNNTPALCTHILLESSRIVKQFILQLPFPLAFCLQNPCQVSYNLQNPFRGQFCRACRFRTQFFKEPVRIATVKTV